MPTKKTKTKVVKKVTHTSKLVKHEPNLKAIIAILVLAVAFGVYLIFQNNQETLMSDPKSMQIFLILAVVLGALLMALLFLINPQKKK
jgi:uncharacterized membrane protein